MKVYGIYHNGYLGGVYSTKEKGQEAFKEITKKICVFIATCNVEDEDGTKRVLINQEDYFEYTYGDTGLGGQVIENYYRIQEMDMK
jgi:hypothetical protein